MNDNAMLYERIARRVLPGCSLARAWRLAGGISAEMTALEVRCANGSLRKLVVRRPGEASLAHDRDAIQKEYRLLSLLHPHGLPVPRPLLLDASSEIFPSAYSVTEYVEGALDFAPADLEDYTRQLAERLAAIHRIPSEAADLTFLPRSGDEPAFFLDAGLDAIDLPFDLPRARQILQDAWPLPQCNPASLLHGDYWPGNVLWRSGRLAAVIDWEDAHTGDPLLDLAGCRMELAWIYGPASAASFTRQYMRHAAIDMTFLPLWDLRAALRMVQWAFTDLKKTAEFFVPFGRGELTPELIHARLKAFIEDT